MLPDIHAERKGIPLFTGVIEYFPDALIEVALVSFDGNKQHNPGMPLHWAKHKSTDHLDCLARHMVQHDTIDVDGRRHMAKASWRSLAYLQMEIEAARAGLTVPEYIKKLQDEANAVA